MNLTLDPARERTARHRSPARTLWLPWNTATLVGTLVTSVMLIRLFAGGVVGMGDQGDGHRLMCSLGLADPGAFDPSGPGYLHPVWSAHRWYGEACGAGGAYHSTEIWLLWPARYLSAFVFGDNGALDLRALGVLCSVLAGLLCAGLVLALRGPLRARVLVAGGIGAVFADSTFAGYFVSPYSEPAALLGIVGTLLALVVIWRRGHTTVPTLLFVAAGALFAIGAKSPMAGFLLPITVGVLTVPYGGYLPLGRASDVSWGKGRRLRWYGRRWPALVILALTFALTLVHVARQPGPVRDQARYAMVFTEILPHGGAPISDLEALGGDPAWVAASGAAMDAPNSLVGTPAYPRFLHRITWSRIGMLYGAHPSRLGKLFYRGVAATAELRPHHLGSYPEAPGHRPYAQEDRVPFFGWLFAVFRWANWLMVTEWILLALTGLLVIRHEILPRWSRVYGHLALWLAAAIPAHLCTEVVTEASGDPTRRMVCVAFMTVAGLPVLAVCSALLYDSLKKHGGFVAAIAATGRARLPGGHAGG